MAFSMMRSRHVLLMLPRQTMLTTSPLFRKTAIPKQCCFATLLTGTEKTKALESLSTSTPFRWDADPSGRDAIVKTFAFRDFQQAWAWMGKVAILAEDMQHHPEWKNIYNMVEVTLTTHDCGGISELDIRMARSMDEFAAEVLPNNPQKD